MEVAYESMESPLYLLSPEASIDATGRQIPSPNPTDYYAAPWSTWMQGVPLGLHKSKIQKLAPAGSFTAVVAELRNRMTAAEERVKTLTDEVTTTRAAAEEQAKTLRADIATLTAAVAAAEERVKTLTDEVTTTRAAAEEQAKTLRAEIDAFRAQADNMASDMDVEEERRDKEANERDKIIEKLQERVKALEGGMTKVKDVVRKF